MNKADFLTPITRVIEPRRRPSSRLSPQWYALCDSHGIPLHFVERRSEYEARESASLNSVLYNGKVKRVGKPAIGWINGQIRQTKEKETSLAKYRAKLEALKARM